ncbi:hypothetical protein CLOP_g19297, partial [Closterium sp. NIES-67]
FFHTS